MEILIQGKSAREIFKALKLEEHSLYKCKVKMTENNVEHHSFLFTGFKTGGYCVIYTNNYEAPVLMQKAYSIRKVKFLSKIKTR